MRFLLTKEPISFLCQGDAGEEGLTEDESASRGLRTPLGVEAGVHRAGSAGISLGLRREDGADVEMLGRGSTDGILKDRTCLPRDVPGPPCGVLPLAPVKLSGRPARLGSHVLVAFHLHAALCHGSHAPHSYL